jgi:hypothetical protein
LDDELKICYLVFFIMPEICSLPSATIADQCFTRLIDAFLFASLSYSPAVWSEGKWMHRCNCMQLATTTPNQSFTSDNRTVCNRCRRFRYIQTAKRRRRGRVTDLPNIRPDGGSELVMTLRTAMSG